MATQLIVFIVILSEAKNLDPSPTAQGDSQKYK